MADKQRSSFAQKDIKPRDDINKFFYLTLEAS